MAITKPYTFISGTKARAGEVNQDFDVVYSEVNRLGSEILGIDVDIQNISDSKADINGNATQRFQVANPENSYDSVNKNYLENSILNIKDYINGFTIVKDTDNTIRVSAGSCYDSTYNTMIVSTGNITKENDNQGANLTYYVYIVSDNTGYQVDVLISTQSGSPALPSGYTLYRQIGYYTTNSDNEIYSIGYYGEVATENRNPLSMSMIPDWVNKVSKTLETTYTAESNGYIVVSLLSSSANSGIACYVNDEIVYYVAIHGLSGANYGEGATIPIAKGDTYKVSGIATRYYFVPVKGGN